MNAAERLQEAVESIAQATSFAEAAQRLLGCAQDLTGCEAAMLRLLEPSGDEQGWIPALIHRGYSARFLQDESLIGAEECMCGRVCLGRGDKTLPFFTEGGSFLWGRVQSIAGEFPQEALGEVRGRCVIEGYESVAVVPLRGSNHEPLGALHLADRAPNKFAAWIDLLEALCGACGPLLMGHEEREAELVAALQAALAPRELPLIPGLEFALTFSSATQSASVGGDFYDLREVSPGEVLVLLGDCCGKGVEVAGTAARIRYTLSSLAQTCNDPVSLLAQADRLLRSVVPPGRFVTVLVCRLTADGRLVLSSAGHPGPLELSPGGDGEEVAVPAHPPIGVQASGAWASADAALPPGWTLLLYTDGITDARREGGLFGVPGIIRSWRQTRSQDLPAFVEALRQAADQYHAGDRPPDDRLALALRWAREETVTP